MLKAAKHGLNDKLQVIKKLSSKRVLLSLLIDQ